MRTESSSVSTHLPSLFRTHHSIILRLRSAAFLLLDTFPFPSVCPISKSIFNKTIVHSVSVCSNSSPSPFSFHWFIPACSLFISVLYRSYYILCTRSCSCIHSIASVSPLCCLVISNNLCICLVCFATVAINTLIACIFQSIEFSFLSVHHSLSNCVYSMLLC